jgi:WD40 repeat protein
MKQLARFSGFHLRAVILLQFSPSGKKLLTVGQDDNHSIAVYNWSQQAMIFSAKTSRGKLNAACWQNEDQFMTCGVSEARFWSGRKGALGKLPGKWDAMTSCFCHENTYVSGSAKGNIYLWMGNSASKPVDAHKGKVQCFAKMDKMLLSGGDDGMIYSWVVSKGQLNPGTFSFIFKDSPYNRGILSLQHGKSGLLVGTKGS